MHYVNSKHDSLLKLFDMNLLSDQGEYFISALGESLPPEDLYSASIANSEGLQFYRLIVQILEGAVRKFALSPRNNTPKTVAELMYSTPNCNVEEKVEQGEITKEKMPKEGMNVEDQNWDDAKKYLAMISPKRNKTNTRKRDGNISDVASQKSGGEAGQVGVGQRTEMGTKTKEEEDD